MVSYCNAMRSTAVTAERQRPRLQQAGTCSNTTTMSTETKEGRKEAAYLLKAAGTQRAPGSAPHLHCQAFNEGWEGVGPGSSPPTHSAVLHCTHLSSLGWPGLPPRAPSLLQAGTQHCHYRWWHMGRMGMPWGGGTWKGGDAMGWWRVGGWRHPVWHMDKMEVPWDGGTWKGGDVMRWWHRDRMEMRWDGGIGTGWRCGGMVAHGRVETSSLAQGQDGDAMGWWHRDRMEMRWDGGTGIGRRR